MPIFNRTRGGQALFTQPQLREDVRFSNQAYFSILSNKLKSKGPAYERREFAPKGLPIAQESLRQQWDNLETMAREAATGMAEIQLKAGSTNLNKEQAAEYAVYAGLLEQTVSMRRQLESIAGQVERDVKVHEQEKEKAKVVGSDVYVKPLADSDILFPSIKRTEDNRVYKETVMDNVNYNKTKSRVILGDNFRYHYDPYNPSGVYDYTGAGNKMIIDLMSKADNQYNSTNGNIVKEKVVTTNDLGGVTAIGDPVALTAFFKSSKYQDDLQAISAVKDKLFDFMMADEKAKTDFSKNFADKWMANPSDAYTELRIATDDDIADKREIIYQIKTVVKTPSQYAKLTDEEKSLYQKDGANYIKRDTQKMVASDPNEEYVIRKMINGEVDNLDSRERQLYRHMLKNYVFERARDLEKVFASSDETITRHTVRLGDAGEIGAGALEPKYANMEDLVTDPIAAVNFAKEGGFWEWKNVQTFSNGQLTNYKDQTPIFNLTGSAAEIIEKQNQGTAFRLATEWGEDFDANDITESQWATMKTLGGITKKAGATKSFMTANGYAIHWEKLGISEPIVFTMNNQVAWMPGQIQENMIMPVDVNSNKNARLPMVSTEFLVDGDQLEDKNVTIGWVNKPDVKTEEIEFNPNEYSVLYGDYEAYGSYEDYLKAMDISGSSIPIKGDNNQYRVPTDEEYRKFINSKASAEYYDYEQDLIPFIKVSLGGEEFDPDNTRHVRLLEQEILARINNKYATEEVVKESRQMYVEFQQRYNSHRDVQDYVYLKNKKDGTIIKASTVKGLAKGAKVSVDIVSWKPYELKFNEVKKSENLMRDFGIEEFGEWENSENFMFDSPIYKIKGWMVKPIQGVGNPTEAGTKYQYQKQKGAQQASAPTQKTSTQSYKMKK
jgi:hypothetical protein